VQILNPQTVLDYMTRVRASGRVRRYPFSSGPGYSQNDPNAFPTDLAYSERIVFGTNIPLASLPNSGSLIDLNNQIAQQTPPAADTGAQVGTQGPLSFNVLPFLAGAASQQVLAANPKRGALLIQNQSAALTIYVNLGQAAAVNQGIQLGPGIGLLFDIKVPNNYVTVVASGGTAPGVAVEGM